MPTKMSCRSSQLLAWRVWLKKSGAREGKRGTKTRKAVTRAALYRKYLLRFSSSSEGDLVWDLGDDSAMDDSIVKLCFCRIGEREGDGEDGMKRERSLRH